MVPIIANLEMIISFIKSNNDHDKFDKNAMKILDPEVMLLV